MKAFSFAAFCSGSFLFLFVACPLRGELPAEIRKSLEAIPVQEAPPAQEVGSDGMSNLQRASYFIGYRIGRDLNKKGMRLDADFMARGLADGASGKEMKADRAAVQGALALLHKQMKEAGAKPTDRRKAGREFLRLNGRKPGVATHPSGLQYLVLKEGEGPNPCADDWVTVRYEARLIDGRVFDGTTRSPRNPTVSFQVSRVIPGWRIGLMLMRPGARFRLFIPENLAYGDRGAPPVGVGPYETLIMDVELIRISHEPPSDKNGK